MANGLRLRLGNGTEVVATTEVWLLALLQGLDTKHLDELIQRAKTLVVEQRAKTPTGPRLLVPKNGGEVVGPVGPASMAEAVKFFDDVEKFKS